MNKKVIDVCGIGHSGKTIVNQILQHNQDIYVHNPLFEFNILRIYGGLINLRSNLVDNYSPNRADMAIAQFKHLIKTISPSARISDFKSLFNSNGWNYNELLGCNFEKISNDYIDSLIDLETQSIWPYPEIYESKFSRFFQRVRKRLFNYERKHSLIFSSSNDFQKKTIAYLEKVLFNNKKNIVCTNNMIEPYNSEKYLNFFNNPFLISVWRDPRDIYVSTKVGNKYIPDFETSKSIDSHHKSFTLSDDIDNFILREKILLSKCDFKNSKRILNIKFEDIVYNFEESIQKLSQFLNIEFGDVDFLKKAINIEKSKSNIGLWKKYHNQQEIDLIKKELSDYMAIFNYE